MSIGAWLSLDHCTPWLGSALCAPGWAMACVVAWVIWLGLWLGWCLAGYAAIGPARSSGVAADADHSLGNVGMTARPANELQRRERHSD